jgi:hypothetical protein
MTSILVSESSSEATSHVSKNESYLYDWFQGIDELVRTVKFAAVDIEAARAALSRLVEGGNAWAAVDLGSTYDPNILTNKSLI